MMKPTFPSTSKPQSHNVTFLTIKTVVRKFNHNDGNTGSCARKCLRKGGEVSVYATESTAKFQMKTSSATPHFQRTRKVDVEGWSQFLRSF